MVQYFLFHITQVIIKSCSTVLNMSYALLTTCERRNYKSSLILSMLIINQLHICSFIRVYTMIQWKFSYRHIILVH